MHEREKIIRRVSVLLAESTFEPGQNFLRPIRFLDLERGLRRVELVPPGEVRSLPPIRTVDDIGFPVAIEISEWIAPKAAASLEWNLSRCCFFKKQAP